MKKLLVLALVCVSTATIPLHAQKAETDEQKAVKKEMLAKYDTNKDGKLDKDELSKMTPEDKAKWKKAFPHKHKKADADSNSASTNSVPATPSK